MSGPKQKEKRAGFLHNWYLYGATLAALVVLGIFSFFLLRTELLKNTQDLGEALARSYSSEERNNLTVYSTLLNFGTEMVDSQVREGKPEEETKAMVLSFFQRVEDTLGKGKVDPYIVLNGRIVAANPWEGDASYDVTGTGWYRQALEADGGVIFTDVYTDVIYDRPVITVAGKCRTSDAVMAFDIFPENFQFELDLSELPDNASFYLCDREGTLIYSRSFLNASEERVQYYVRKLLESIERGEQDSYDAYITDLSLIHI